MDDQVFVLLNDKIENVDRKVDSIAADVKEMLAFKWQIIGGSVIVSLVVGSAIQLVLSMVTK